MEITTRQPEQLPYIVVDKACCAAELYLVKPFNIRVQCKYKSLSKAWPVMSSLLVRSPMVTTSSMKDKEGMFVEDKVRDHCGG